MMVENEKERDSVHPTRRLLVPGLMNCRDLGGYAAAGGVTRWGVFYRSEAPCGLPEEGIAYFRALGLGESIDLRGEAEIAWRPSALAEVFPYRRISLSGGAETFEKKNLPEGPFSWDKVYIKRAREHRDWVRDVVTALAEAEGSVLFHCTTGKDRTGIIACCLLGAVGVSREDIAADYCLSQVYLQDMFEGMRTGRITIRKEPGNFEDYVFQTPFQAMLDFYDFFTREFGGIVPYLRDIGVTEKSLAKLKARFLDAD